MSALIRNVLNRLKKASGAQDVGFKRTVANAKERTVHDALDSGAISIFDVMTRAQIDEAVNSDNSTTDLTWAWQEVLDYLQTKSKGYTSPRFVVRVPRAKFPILDPNGILINYNANILQVSFIAEEGANLIGNGTNNIFNFTNGGSRNKFEGLTFEKAARAILWKTQNRDQSRLMLEDCISGKDVDIFLDTGSYSESRSSEVNINNCLIDQSRVAVRSFVDQMTFQNSRIYAREGSYDAPLYLSGDGVVAIEDTLLIPHANQIDNLQNARWIDFVSDPAESTPNDRSVKSLVVSRVRASLESARPFIWTFDTCPDKPSGNNRVSSITIQDSPILGTGGYPLVWFRQGYPGSVSLRNAKAFASEQIVALYTENTNPPKPSRPGAITSCVIQIDEATRLSQSNDNNIPSLVDPKLHPFLIDGTTQTSKFLRSLPEDNNYRRRCIAAGPGRVKSTFKMLFDHENAAHNRDLLSFILITVSDAGAAPACGRAMYHGIVSFTAANQDSQDWKQLNLTTLQNAAGGIGYGATATPSVFFGSGDNGSSIISSSSNTGVEDQFTVAFPGTVPDACWVYLLPLAGIRDNQWDKQQYGIW